MIQIFNPMAAIISKKRRKQSDALCLTLSLVSKTLTSKKLWHSDSVRTMALMLKVPANCIVVQQPKRAFLGGAGTSRLGAISTNRKQRVSSSSSSAISMIPKMSISAIPNQRDDKSMSKNKIDIPIMVMLNLGLS